MLWSASHKATNPGSGGADAGIHKTARMTDDRFAEGESS